MKKIILLFAVVFVSTGSVFNNEKVMICNSSNAYAYHKEYCQGLSRCSKEILMVTKEEAIRQYGKKKACGFCY